MKSVKSGISLVEVIIAVLMLSVATSSLLGLQGALLRGVFSAHLILDRLSFIGSYFVEVEKEQLLASGSTHKKRIEDPSLSMEFSLKKVTAKGLSSHEHLVMEQIDAEWPTPFGSRKESFARLQFRPQKKGVS